MRLLGECYNYLLMDSRTLFEQLYSCLSHGHDSAERAAKLDPPDDFFRARMVGSSQRGGAPGWCCFSW
jgi:regulator of nonsense transcripts 2